MISSGVIERFVVLINPIIFSYEKLCVLVVKNIVKTTEELDIFKKLSLLGDLVAYSEESIILRFSSKGNSKSVKVLIFFLISLLILYSYGFETLTLPNSHLISVLVNNAG
jgi:hypothetical protein